jgi:hypothetical protein
MLQCMEDRDALIHGTVLGLAWRIRMPQSITMELLKYTTYFGIH